MSKSLKVLHVVGSMDHGGVETWLMHMVRNVDTNLVSMDFLLHKKNRNDFVEELVSKGVKIHYFEKYRNLLSYLINLHSINKKFGPYEVIHSHVYEFSGIVVMIGYLCGIKKRIVHCHTAGVKNKGSLRFLYSLLMRKLISIFATEKLAISKSSGVDLFGESRLNSSSFSILYYGFDFSIFRKTGKPREIKLSLGIPQECKVIGHIGRFDPVKNHEFILDVFDKIRKIDSNTHLLFVGGGRLEQNIKELSIKLGLADRCTFLGVQSNVVQFLQIMDIMLLPSHWEGLGIVALEAQAAGVPVLASTNVPNDIDIVDGLVKRVSLKDSSERWAEHAITLMNCGKNKDALKIVEKSIFGLDTCVKNLIEIYRR